MINTDSNSIHPLEPPRTYNLDNLPRLKRILDGLGIIDIIKRELRYISLQMKLRDASTLDLWGNDPAKMEIVNFCSEAIQNQYGWPNRYFIPEDPLYVLMYVSKSTRDQRRVHCWNPVHERDVYG